MLEIDLALKKKGNEPYIYFDDSATAAPRTVLPIRFMTPEMKKVNI